MKIKSLRNDNVSWAVVKSCTIIIITLSCPCIAVTSSSTGPLQRLAILSSGAVQESGLSDLLTAQLQELAVVELVERDLLQKVLDEVALSMMLGAEQSENRRKTGALLKANMLVLLSLEEIGGKNNVKIVISDCSNGARLHVGWVPFDELKLENTCRDLTKVVTNTLERFEGGVKQIIGVSHFVSRALVHDYDHLQAGYAYLLENALSSSPGVAVIEIEEARSIMRENELAGDERIERVVPLFVEGEFKVQNAVSKKEAMLNMSIRISDSAGVINQIEREDLSMDKVAEFITDDIALEILKLSKSPSLKLLDKEQQFLALVASASKFAKLGAWEHSTGLREAAVLLKTDSSEQRIKLIDEYHLIIKKLVSKPKEWHPSFEHLEYMIYNRMVNFEQAFELCKKCLYRIPSSGRSYKRDFLLKVYPEILDLEPIGATALGQQMKYEKWYSLLMGQVRWSRLEDFYGGCPDKDDLDFYLELHDNVLPEEMGPSFRFILFLQDHAQPGWRKRAPACDFIRTWYFPGHPEYFSEQEFLDFITAMSNSKKPLSSFYGRYTLLLREYYKRRDQGKAMDGLRDDVVSLLKEIEKHNFSIFDGRLSRENKSLYNETKSLLKKVDPDFPGKVTQQETK